MKTALFRLAPLALACAAFSAAAAPPKLDPQLAAATADGGMAEALVAFRERADPLLLDPKADVVARRTAWVGMLRATAERSQADLLDWLRARGVEHRVYWINNSVWVRADAATLSAMAQRTDVARVYANPAIAQRLPQAMPTPQGALQPQPDALLAVEWNIAKVRAPQVWAAGVKGAGVVIAGEDTGIRWDHAALKSKYRGWNGTSADHNYNWHDAMHSGTIAGCAPNAAAPCDGHNHGTHTMGTMVGDDGGTNQIGMAPDAKWIGCRNVNGSGVGTPASYTECMQWMLAPTDLAGSNPDPAKAPDVVSNSWACPPEEGCTSADMLETAVENIVAAGIFFPSAAGNDGSACATILYPPSTYAAAFVVGSTTTGDAMSSFSSRGPVAGVSGKPDVVAPGGSTTTQVRSAFKDGSYGGMMGTSMAAPNVAGAAALLISAQPSLRGHPDRIADILRATAVHISNSQTCGGIAPTTFPNPVQGSGRIDVYAAYLLAADSIFADGFE